MSKKVLVVVDVQKDFYDPNGSLYVYGGNVLVEKIVNVLPMFDDVVFTLDWHPYNHCSFNNNGGKWPVHCVAYTEGASLPNEFSSYLDGSHNVVTKGTNPAEEEYGADPNAIMLAHNENPDDVEFVFCGIAGDYCVKETVEKFRTKFPDVKVSVYVVGTISIDGGPTLFQYMKKNNIPEWRPEE